MVFDFFSLYDIVQNRRIHAAADKAERARDAADDLEARVETLERRLAVQLMTSEALWSFIKRNHGHDDDELVEALKEIEERIGRLDGMAVKEATRACPACGRTLLKTTGTCLYCGHKADPQPFGTA
jgi:hypothetical protein